MREHYKPEPVARPWAGALLAVDAHHSRYRLLDGAALVLEIVPEEDVFVGDLREDRLHGRDTGRHDERHVA